MAIFRWTGEGSQADIASWYNSVNHGCPIKVSSSGSYLYFKDPESYNSIYVSIYSSSSTSNDTIKFAGMLQTNSSIRTWTSYGGFWIYGVIVCSNGILFKTYGRRDANSWSTSYDYGFTLDKFGTLTFLCRLEYYDYYYRTPPKSGVYQWQAIGVGTPTLGSSTLILKPQYNMDRTALSPIIPSGGYSGSEGNFLPNAYFGTQTQLSGEGLTAVRINGVDYITNGVIYIRDTPAE